ncbi:SDR family oxidoreductase [Rhodococcus koreensis]
MTQRAALITGGSSGIGLAIAQALGADGYRLTITARHPEKLEHAAEQLRSLSPEVLAVPASLGDEEQIKAVFAAHEEHYGRLDVLINNGGTAASEAIESITTRRLDLQLDVNLRGLILCTREGLPMLRKAGSEHGKALIVNVASISGKQGEAMVSAYSATKFAVVGFSQATQKECDKQGIQVTAFCPAFVDTPMTDFIKGHVPTDEMIQPSDLAEAVRYLLRTSPSCLVPEIVFARPGGGP